MKDDSGLPDLTKVQSTPNDQIEEIVRRESSIARRFNMVARDQKFLISIRRGEGGAFRIVSAAGKKLQRQKRMRCSALSQIDLDGVGFPGSRFVRARDDEIDCETANDTCVSQ